MKLIFERSVPAAAAASSPACDVEETPLPESLRRAEAPVLPELSEQDLSRHYTELNHHVHGVNCGFYPLGSCTMKYNPRINEEMAALPALRVSIRWLPPTRCRAAVVCWSLRSSICVRSRAWTA